MSDAIKILGLVFIIAILAVLLGELGFRGARLVSALGTLAVVMMTLGLFGEVIGMLDGVIALGGIDEAARVAIKIIGVGYVFGVGSDICLDMGERGIAVAVLGVGRVEILLLALPFVIDVVEGAVAMIRGAG